MLTRLALAATVLLLPATAAAAPLTAGSTALVGAAAPGATTALPTPADTSDVHLGALSENGRYVAFESRADGLTGDDDDRVRGVYVKDRLTGAVELVSRASGAAGAANAESCGDASISDDGQRVAFTCFGPLEAVDTNKDGDVYVRDRTAQTTTLVSRGATAANGASGEAQISGNGAYVAFESYATNLVPGGSAGNGHVFRRQLGGPGTVLQVDTVTGSAPNDSARLPTISDDGTRVAFLSYASNLVPGGSDANGTGDVFWRSLPAGSVALVSNAAGSTTAAANGSTDTPAISGDGLYVAYASNASNVGDGDTDAKTDVHRRTLGSAVNVLVSRASGPNGVKSDGSQYGLAIDESGDAIAFASNAATLDGAPAPTRREIYVRRVGAATLELASRAGGAAGAPSATDVNTPVLSDDGATVVFQGRALTADADSELDAVFARSFALPTRPTTLVSRPAGDASFANPGARASIEQGAVSADGRYVVFLSAARGLPGSPGNGVAQVWRRDQATGDVVLVSRAAGPAGAAASGATYSPRISADGNRVAFVTIAANLADGGPGVLVRDIAAQTTSLASRTDGAAGAGVASAWSPAISADGRRVAFVSDSPALGVKANAHVFVRDLGAGTTTAVAASQPGKADLPQLDGSGARVVWATEVPDGGGGGSGVRRAWVADVATGAPTSLAPGTSGPEDNAIVVPSISADGTRAAFTSYLSLLPADTNHASDIYVRDLATGALTWASRTSTGGAGSEGGYGGLLSADGRRVVFTTGTKDAAAGDADEFEDVYLRDLDAGTTTLASVGTTTDDTEAFAVSADGGCVAFSTADTALAPGLSPFVTRAWLRAVRGTCPGTPVGHAGTGPGTGGQTGGEGTPPGKQVVVKPKRPVVAGFKASPTAFKTTGRKPGTTLRFTLDQAAAVRLVVARPTKGHKVGKACRAKAPRRGQKACTRSVTLTTLRKAGKQGANAVAFTGKVKGKRLAKGRYRVSVVATSAGGASAARTVTLTVR